MIFHCSFDLHFSNDYPPLVSFYVLIDHLYVIGNVCVSKTLLNFVFIKLVVLSISYSSLFTLEINLLSDM